MPRPDRTSTTTARITRAAVGFTLLTSLALQWRWFEESVRHYVLPTFPAHHDQAAYLILAYGNDAMIRSEGLWRAALQRLTTGSATGSLLDLEAALAFRLLEPNRLGALAVTFAHFAALQIAFCYVAMWATRTLAFGVVAVALLAASGFLFVVPGGLFDFRIDAAASCAFGIWIAALVRSRFYRERGWAVAAGIAAGYTIALRHNMVVHLAALHALLLTAIAGRELRGGGMRRTRNILVSAATMVAVCGPALYFSYSEIATYYASQLGERGPVRSALSGRSMLAQWAFYPVNVAVHHTRFMPAVAALALLLPWLDRATPRDAARPSRRLGVAALYGPLLAAVAVPLAILSLHTNRSTTVAGLVLPPIVLITTFVLAGASGEPRLRSPRRAVALAGAAVAILAAGTAVHGLQHRMWRAGEGVHLAAGREVFALHHRIASVCAERGLHAPTYFTNSLEDELDPAIGATALFESERRILVPHNPAVRDQIFATSAPELGRIARASDVILLQTRGERVQYPFVAAAQLADDVVRREIADRFVEIGAWSTADSAATAYVARRP